MQTRGPGWPEGVGRFIYPETASSSLAAAQKLREGETAPFWLLAEKQTGGHGRRGRAWATPDGNFAASYAMRPDALPDAALRSFTTALALRDTFVELTGRDDLFDLKWPNDVLIRGKKLAGILLESGTDKMGPWLVIGVGVNLAAAPGRDAVEPGALLPAALGPELGVTPPPATFLDHFADRFALWESRLMEQGFATIRRAWMDHAVGHGEEITVRLPNETLEGRFADIDGDGALLLETPVCLKRIPAGEVYLKGEANAPRD
ncbi:biotin--[acetyl-CoA-carboxylase] ligase [Paracoccaceae bacterium GXU_MW_L88]